MTIKAIVRSLVFIYQTGRPEVLVWDEVQVASRDPVGAGPP